MRPAWRAGSLEVVMLRHVLAHNGGAEDVMVAHLVTLLRQGRMSLPGRRRPHRHSGHPRGRSTPTWSSCRSGTSPSAPPGAMTTRPGCAWPSGLVGAGLELVEFRGRYVIRELSPGLRSPAWAAREAMVAAGMATAEDLRRWERAFEATAAAVHPATFFAPMFTAIGRRPTRWIQA